MKKNIFSQAYGHLNVQNIMIRYRVILGVLKDKASIADLYFNCLPWSIFFLPRYRYIAIVHKHSWFPHNHINLQNYNTMTEKRYDSLLFEVFYNTMTEKRYDSLLFDFQLSITFKSIS